MSGGIAYVYDPNNLLQPLCSPDVQNDLEPLREEEDKAELKSLIQMHVKHTRSKKGQAMLLNWEQELPKFKKVCVINKESLVVSSSGTRENKTRYVFVISKQHQNQN